jgi:hypothetical protein
MRMPRKEACAGSAVFVAADRELCLVAVAVDLWGWNCIAHRQRKMTDPCKRIRSKRLFSCKFSRILHLAEAAARRMAGQRDSLRQCVPAKGKISAS